MNKEKICCFKLTKLDFEAIKKQAKKRKMTVSQMLRRILKYHMELNLK